MMKEILRLIHETGVVNTSEIADAIGTTQSMVQQAITTLQSKGYLAADKPIAQAAVTVTPLYKTVNVLMLLLKKEKNT